MSRFPSLMVWAAVFLAVCAALFSSVAPAGAQNVAPALLTISPLETHVLGQNRWLGGGPGALRVVVTDHQTGQPVRANVTLTLTPTTNGTPSGAAETLYSGRTDSLGTLDAQFRAPVVSDDTSYLLTVAVQARIGHDQVTQNVTVTRAAQTLLTADKPVYQPGQIMHLRALALDEGTRRPLTNTPITFEIEDARGNKVFKQHETLSAFGVASCDFQLADEVNMGTFTLRAMLPQGETEKKVQVERYLLPKFKVSVTTDHPYYLPGQTVRGTVEAHYFFGKPVAGGQVALDVNTVDVGVTKLGAVNGKTGPDGKFTFQYVLPDSFVGQPFEEGKAVVGFDGTLKDTADQMQEVHQSVPVVQNPLDIELVPENHALVPGIVNRVFIAVATPDGQPLKGVALEAEAYPAQGGAPLTEPTRLTTDSLGLATFAFTPDSANWLVSVRATDSEGRVANAQQNLTAGPSQEGLILRVDRPLAKVGEDLTLTALSNASVKTVYFDVIRDKQTILTRATDEHGGTAQITLPVTPDMAGTLEIHAYQILPNEDIVRDSRLVVVSPANDLRVRMTADQVQYRPGDDALLKFSVRDSDDNPVSAAVGVAVVDESVFSLSELQPGLEKIYFTLEHELMEPRYEIHGLSPAYLLNPSGAVYYTDPERQQAATMLLSVATPQTDFDINVDTYQEHYQAVKAQVTAQMQQAARAIWTALSKYRQNTGAPLGTDQTLADLAAQGYLTHSDISDPWGHEYRVNLNGNDAYDSAWTLESAGPDGLWDTSDDINGISPFEVQRFMALGVIRAGAFGGGGFGGMGGGMGGFGGGGFGARAAFAAPMPMSQDMIANGNAINMPMAASNPGINTSPAPRVRQYFPETLYWNPALITDSSGNAEVRVPLADSITTWRVSMMGNSASGLLGSGDAPIKVFQDFFVDMDLPLALTQGDSVQVPITVYNYLPQAQDVTLTLDKVSGLTLRGPAQQSVHVAPGQVTVVYYPVVATGLGSLTLTVTAQGTKLSDAVRRTVEVTPDGQETRATINDRLEGSADKTVSFPPDALNGDKTIWVKIYPGAFSQVVDGLDGMIRMPGGCFEQTSSSLYPDVLILSYLKATNHINPELQMHADGDINVGYQRLVTFEVPGGGFSWFGQTPAHQILTAYGLLEFSDMAKVHDVDPDILSRTQKWLAGKQLADGTWNETNQGIAEGIINRQTGALRTTAYVAWALAASGYKGPEVARGVAYVRAHLSGAADAYTLAVILNLLATVDRDGDETADVAHRLIALATQTDKTAFWNSGDTQTFTGAQGAGADTETTGLAAYGLIQWGRETAFMNKVLNQLVKSKDSFGTWASTQGTVWSLKTLLYASGSQGSAANGTVTILANGQPAASFKITPDDSDVMRQIDLAKFVKPGENQIHLQYAGDGTPVYQIVARSYVPWADVPPAPADKGPLTIHVAYDKTTLAQNDTVNVTATVHNNTDKTAEMPLIDLGLPPGFTPDTSALDTAVNDGRISKVTVAARQIIVYMEQLGPGQTVTLNYKLTAKYPIKARTPLSRVYPYYDPQRVSVSAPQALTVDAETQDMGKNP